MKKTRSLFMTKWLTLFSLLFMLIACSDKLGKSPTLDVFTGEITIEGIENGSPILLKSTETKQLHLEVTPNVGSDVSEYTLIRYKSSSEDVFTVSKSGVLKGRQNGKADLTITAKTGLIGDEIEANFTVSVTEQVMVADLIIDEELRSGVLLKEEEKINLLDYISVVPIDAFNTQLQFSSMDETVARIVDNVLYAGSGGRTIINVRTIDGSNLEDKFDVCVEAPIKVWYDDEKASWDILNSHQIFSDGGGSTADPKELIDGDVKSFINMKKPGKDVSIGAEEALFFTVDTKSTFKINRIYFHHRNDNTLARLRLWGFDLEGSSDGKHFIPIQHGLRIPDAEIDGIDSLEAVVFLDKVVEYQFLRVICNYYDEEGGYSIQIAEIRLGYDESLDSAS